jgi:tRNA-binding EMAP/Myf-like protein
MNDSLVYVGKIIHVEKIPDADFIISVTVVCGKGGKWKG